MRFILCSRSLKGYHYISSKTQDICWQAGPFFFSIFAEPLISHPGQTPSFGGPSPGLLFPKTCSPCPVLAWPEFLLEVGLPPLSLGGFLTHQISPLSGIFSSEQPQQLVSCLLESLFDKHIYRTLIYLTFIMACIMCPFYGWRN